MLYICVSPILKSKLIERGVKMGVNLSDYIGYVLTKDMSGENDPKLSDEFKDLLRKSQKLQTELSKYEAITEPYKDWLNKEFKVNGQSVRFEHPVELLRYFATNFKIKP